MELVIIGRGQVRCIYDERIDLAALGKLSIKRASYVEPNASGHWIASLHSVGGPNLGPYGRRSEALRAEYEWLVWLDLDTGTNIFAC